MKVRVLGAHNLETENNRHTCFLVDDEIVIDAGSLMTSLSAAEQEKIHGILVTHRHFDHIRDLPSLALANLDSGGIISVYSLAETLQAVSSRLMDGVLYPDFTKSLTERGPKYRLQAINPGIPVDLERYVVRPISVPHSTVPAVGYIVHQGNGHSFAYCGDTGGEILPFFADPFRPDPICVEVTFSQKMEERAKLTGHLTPGLLRNELVEAISQKLTIPRILIVHRNPAHEKEITDELAKVASELGIEITLAHEGMTVEV